MGENVKIDLVVLVADRHMEQAFIGLLEKPNRLNIRDIEFRIYVHPRHDPGCRLQAVDFLRPFQQSSRYALVAFDRAGFGSELPPDQIQDDVERKLSLNGWKQRCQVIVIDPELETWVWMRSAAVSQALGWDTEFNALEQWLRNRNLWPSGQPKPIDPKEAMEAAMRHAPASKRPRRSSALFKRIATSAQLSACCDPAFVHLRETLHSWFPQE